MKPLLAFRPLGHITHTITDAGEFDLAQQRKIASATGRFDEARRQIARLGEWSGKACIG